MIQHKLTNMNLDALKEVLPKGVIITQSDEMIIMKNSIFFTSPGLRNSGGRVMPISKYNFILNRVRNDLIDFSDLNSTYAKGFENSITTNSEYIEFYIIKLLEAVRLGKEDITLTNLNQGLVALGFSPIDSKFKWIINYLTGGLTMTETLEDGSKKVITFERFINQLINVIEDAIW